jgi:hypothetical protein
VKKLTGHRSEALKRYQHLSPQFRAMTTDLLAKVLTDKAGDTRRDTPAKKMSGTAEGKKCNPKKDKGLDGRPVGTRIPDLYRVNSVSDDSSDEQE